MHPRRPVTLRTACLTAIAVAFTGCAAATKTLNSERIATRYGNYGVELLRQDDATRRTSLFSTDSHGRVTRTFALVQFEAGIAEEIQDLHNEVLRGSSLGATYREAGFGIRKSTLYIGELDLPSERHVIARMMKLDRSEPLAMHVYRLTLTLDGQAWPYAAIAEVHHPDYLRVDDLRELYRDGCSAGLDTVEITNTVAMLLDQEWALDSHHMADEL